MNMPTAIGSFTDEELQQLGKACFQEIARRKNIVPPNMECPECGEWEGNKFIWQDDRRYCLSCRSDITPN